MEYTTIKNRWKGALSRSQPGFTTYKIENGLVWKLIDKSRVGMVARFKEAKDGLSIFEADLLYSAYSGKKPWSYLRFHESPAGIEFFNNLEYITLLESKKIVVPGETLR